MKRVKRKRLIVWSAMVIVLLVVGWIIWTNVHIATTHLTITNGKIPADFSGFKIAEIADLHNHDWGNRLISCLAKEEPDIIVITGDLVDSSHTDFDISMEFINQAKKIAPIYYVTGNHEAWLENYPELEKRLIDSSVHMMDDKTEWLERGSSKINLIGIQDPDFVGRDTLEGIQKSIVTTKLTPLLNHSYYNIVLCHRPELFYGYVETQADLVITGHAHGGQVRIPFVGGLIAPNQGLFPKFTEGVYHQGQTDMVVSRGLGNSVIPVRINNMPELVVITLKH